MCVLGIAKKKLECEKPLPYQLVSTDKELLKEKKISTPISGMKIPPTTGRKNESELLVGNKQ